MTAYPGTLLIETITSHGQRDRPARDLIGAHVATASSRGVQRS